MQCRILFCYLSSVYVSWPLYCCNFQFSYDHSHAVMLQFDVLCHYFWSSFVNLSRYVSCVILWHSRWELKILRYSVTVRWEAEIYGRVHNGSHSIPMLDFFKNIWKSYILTSSWLMSSVNSCWIELNFFQDQPAALYSQPWKSQNHTEMLYIEYCKMA